jgi:hypothetical protein
MGVRIETMEIVADGELIIGSAEKRIIYVDLEPITPKATRIRVIARNGGILYDSATAAEIVLQAEKAFAGDDESAARGASKRAKR